jgi:hypothetical protein
MAAGVAAKGELSAQFTAGNKENGLGRQTDVTFGRQNGIALGRALAVQTALPAPAVGKHTGTNFPLDIHAVASEPSGTGS